MQKLNYIEFNYRLKRARYDTESFEIFYGYCLPIIKSFIVYKFGYNQSISFLETAPFDVITRILFDCPPKGIVFKPKEYLCRVTKNFVMSQYNLKDNQTLELNEEIAYVHVYSDGFNFSSPGLKDAWDRLDESSRYIIIMNVHHGWDLKELSAKLNLSYDYVRQKKSRALRYLEDALKNKLNK